MIDQIRAGAARAKSRGLLESAASIDEWKAIAEDYANENDALRAERDSLDGEVSRLSELVRLAESDKAALSYQLRSLGQVSGSDTDEIEPDFSEEFPAPTPGETRYYKKQYATPSHDILIQVGDCGHNSWQNAPKAEKARKGIERLEKSSEWRTIQHCGSCTGGGMWRVRW
ncbi:MAG: hypothetical protein AB7W59_14220 [Acidimicrobiia bacterium]